ncbi:unnamed protein product [Porites lobata]|uniref:Protein kinase domain-containing protein n=1 Tax=Porites lobata TaxID=104759 RepID=A0ABN8Q4G2_9CNID|nr:unnamed protein product [Porites lobata]
MATWKNISEEIKEIPISTKDKIKIARDVANGMLHLSSKRCVHRDLAARNVLLGKDNVAMVSDFGLSRDVYQSGAYEQIDKQRPLPIRWMAIECLNGLAFTTESDVWSFGVLMWEIESGGAKPYPTMGNVLEIKDFLNNGRRLTKPHGCLPEIYEIMKRCWEKERSERPTFRELLASLEEELRKSTGASDPVINPGQESEDRMAAHEDQLPMYQRSQASGASSNRPAPVNDAGPITQLRSFESYYPFRPLRTFPVMKIRDEISSRLPKIQDTLYVTCKQATLTRSSRKLLIRSKRNVIRNRIRSAEKWDNSHTIL